MISVCMATYNGEKYIEQQLVSILKQLSDLDEVIICDDCSSDSTVSIIASIGDPRVVIYKNTSNLGYIDNFRFALSKANGDLIFLADQDDIWPTGRAKKMLEHLVSSKKSVVVGNFETFTGTTSPVKFSPSLSEKNNNSGFLNIIKMFKGGIPYYGCCMLLKRQAVDIMLKTKGNQVSHDIAIALYFNLRNQIHHCSEVVLSRRLHDSNVTSSNRNIFEKLKTRVLWLIFLFKNLNIKD